MSMFFLLFSVLFTQNAMAFKLNLIDSTLDLGAGSFSTTATIVNDGESMIAIEAGARVRNFSLEGVEDFDKEAENLIVIPSQVIIAPGSEQVLSIRWTGSTDIPAEQAYRLLIEYVSISQDKLNGMVPQEQQAGINVNYRIAKSFYVSPKGAKPEVILTDAKKETIDGTDMLRLSFENSGTQHQIIHGLDVEFTTPSAEVIPLSLDSVILGGSVNFLAQGKRDVLLSWPKVLAGKEIASTQIVSMGR